MHPNDQEYIRLQRKLLLKDEKALRAMSAKYAQAKAAFDADCAARGISWEQNPLAYTRAKQDRIQLSHWYSKVEHFQREVAARAALITAFEAAHRMVADSPQERKGRL